MAQSARPFGVIACLNKISPVLVAQHPSEFIARCNSKSTTATATLTQFIELYLDDSLDNLDAIGGNDLDKRLDSRIQHFRL